MAGDAISVVEVGVGELIFRCPYTNRPITTQILLDRRTVRASADCPIRIHCLLCGFDHDGRVGDGQFLSDAA